MRWIFDISDLFIQSNRDTCVEHITGSVDMYSYVCISLFIGACAFFPFIYLCDIKSDYLCVIPNQITSNTHVVCVKSSVNSVILDKAVKPSIWFCHLFYEKCNISSFFVSVLLTASIYWTHEVNVPSKSSIWFLDREFLILCELRCHLT